MGGALYVLGIFEPGTATTQTEAASKNEKQQLHRVKVIRPCRSVAVGTTLDSSA